MMQVGKDHKLVGIPYEHSPNQTAGFEMKPELLVIHYTATSNTKSTLDAMKSPALRASAHLLIGRLGEVYQLVPFNRKAWHAGSSRWKGQSGCNGFSIGIELVNPGPVVKGKDGIYRSVYNKPYDGDPETEKIDPVVPVNARHKSGLVAQWRDWAPYDPKQYKTAVEVAQALTEHYKIGDIAGHDDIAPGRKFDPGPAFPMQEFQRSVLGGGRDDDGDGLYEVISDTLNVRKGPADPVTRALSDIVGEPLLRGMRVELVDASATWWHVVVPGMKIEGWVNSKFLR